ncbi:MAG: hypothetical protein PWP31_805 [Clostridia bacterium]|nr:hypothetical protein [Clostridia bacterium]
MAEIKDMYKLGQSQTGSIAEIGQEIRIDLQLEDSVAIDTGTVFGKVLDGNGDPISGATIKITDTDYNPLYHAFTDSNGDYTINNVAAGKQYLIFAVKNEYNLTAGTQFIIQANQQIERNFVMTPDTNAANLVAGEIFNEAGEKLEGAIVRLYDNYNEEPVLLKETHTNQFGQYAFFDVPQGMYLITSSLLGYKTAESSFVLYDPEKVININLTMVEDPISKQGTISGIIKDKDGIPIEGAYVILFEVITDEQGNETLNPIRKTATNAEGLYLFEQVPQGNYKIKANKLKNAV